MRYVCQEKKMKRAISIFTVVAFAAALAAAQSSGNFSYGNTGSTHCVLNSSNGAITGGAICSSGTNCTANGCSPIPEPGTTCGGTINAGIKTSSGSGNFSYGNTGSTHCLLNSGTGEITGGATCAQRSVCDSTGCTIEPGAQDCAGSLNAGIKTNSGYCWRRANDETFSKSTSRQIRLRESIACRQDRRRERDFQEPRHRGVQDRRAQ